MSSRGARTASGGLVPRSVTYNGTEYQIITMAWCRCNRSGDHAHSTAMDLYSLSNVIPNDWVLRVENMRLLLSDAARADLRQAGQKSYWPHISPNFSYGSEYAVSFSRNPLLSSSGSGTIRGPLTAELLELPQTHNGQSAFQFKLSFSEDVATGESDIEGEVFEVVGGTITNAWKDHKRSHKEWRIEIRPNSLKISQSPWKPIAPATPPGRSARRTAEN